MLEKSFKFLNYKKSSQLQPPPNKKASSRENPSKKHSIKKHFNGKLSQQKWEKNTKINYLMDPSEHFVS